jgi:signal transduction histidine kinase
MKICSRFFIVFIVTLALCFPAFAAENRKKEMTDAVNTAAKILETKGKAGMEELKSFRFAGGEGYVYLTNMDFIVIMHPVAKELVGKDCTAIRDTKGKYFGAEMKSKVLKDGSGWTSYWWPNAKKNNTPELKCSYFRTATMDGQKVAVYAALFDVGECQ